MVSKGPVTCKPSLVSTFAWPSPAPKSLQSCPILKPFYLHNFTVYPMCTNAVRTRCQQLETLAQEDMALATELRWDCRLGTLGWGAQHWLLEQDCGWQPVYLGKAGAEASKHLHPPKNLSMIYFAPLDYANILHGRYSFSWWSEGSFHL